MHLAVYLYTNDYEALLALAGDIATGYDWGRG